MHYSLPQQVRSTGRHQRLICGGANGKVFRTTLDANVIAYDSGALHRSGTFGNVAAGTQAAKWPRDGMLRAPARTYRETVLRVNEAFPKLGGRNRLRARHVCGKYFVESIM